MSDPEQALDRARSSAAEMRARGAYQGDTPRAPGPDGTVSESTLSQWAVIDPDLRNVRSTRRHGGPLTSLKLLLVRLLGQYHAELISQQTRFNVKLVEELGRLERRVEALERRLDDGGK